MPFRKPAVSSKRQIGQGSVPDQSGPRTFPRLSYRQRRYLTGYLFAAPALLSLAVFVIAPFGFGLLNSLQSGFGNNVEFVGLRNYQDLFTSARFWNSVRVTVFFTMVYASVSMTLAFFIAYALDMHGIKFKPIFTSAIFLPYVVTPAIATLVWQYMFNSDFGILNYVITSVGLPKLRWLQTGTGAMTSLIIVQVWFTLGYNMMLFASGLRSIPSNYYEAAVIDGAGEWAKIRHITLPLLTPTIVFITVLSLMGGFVHSFDVAQVLTGGGPFRATEVLMLYIYRTAFQSFDIPLANALTIVMFLLLFTLSFMLNRWQDRAYKGLH
ncbi:MAG: sugar ABC transporter permease [Thioalkalivibrio sp.]|nr:sugar ABC transporter permease [Thioalkalivibrio sp.]